MDERREEKEGRDGGRRGDSLVDGLDVLGLEGRAADDESVEDDADGPRVDLEAVAIRLVEQHLGRDVVGRAADRLLALAGDLDERGEPEVADLDVHVLVEEDVAELEVAVDDLVRVHVLARADELHHEEARLGLGEAAPAAEHVHEGAIVAELEGHVDVVFVLETVLEADDVGVLERLVDLDFCIKLASSSRSTSTIEARGESVLWFWLSYF